MSTKICLVSGLLAGTFALAGVAIGSRITMRKAYSQIVAPTVGGKKPMPPPIRPEDVEPKPYADGSRPQMRPAKAEFSRDMPDFDLTKVRRGWWPL
ncbi:MAG: hypothetical protein ABF617_05720 [Gluconobacter japonicus]|uniref:hypothetical protein n=1 Tax=Gluconobacter japonicus TaxID=376620 RepID=UPI0039EABD3B